MAGVQVVGQYARVSLQRLLSYLQNFPVLCAMPCIHCRNILGNFPDILIRVADSAIGPSMYLQA